MFYMIKSFADVATEDLFNGTNSKSARSIPTSTWTVAQRKLDLLNAATSLKDLMAPPGNRLEALKGDLAGKHSIRVNDQYRIVFRFEQGDAFEVQVVDYH